MQVITQIVKMPALIISVFTILKSQLQQPSLPKEN